MLRGLVLLAIGLLLASAMVGWLLQPERAGPYLLRQVGNALGLRLRADAVDYRLRGTACRNPDEASRSDREAVRGGHSSSRHGCTDHTGGE